MLILAETQSFTSALVGAGVGVRASGYTGGCQYAFATDRGRVVLPWEDVDRRSAAWTHIIAEIAARPIKHNFKPEAAKAPPGG